MYNALKIQNVPVNVLMWMLACRISVEGNIGVGKSTLLQSISEDTLLNNLVQSVFEPVEEWRKVSCEQQNLLDAYYTDPR